MNILGNSDKPGAKRIIFIKSFNSFKCFRKSLNGNIFRFVSVAGFFKLKTINAVPKSIEQIIKSRLTPVLGSFNFGKKQFLIYFQCLGFEMLFAINMPNWMKIKNTS